MEPAEVRGWVVAQRVDATQIVNSREERREKARIEYEEKLAKIEETIAGASADIAACDAVIARIDKRAAKAGAR